MGYPADFNMTENISSSWFLNHDRFRGEAEQFRRDVHLLILGTLDAALKAIETDFKQEDADLQAAMKEATGEHHEYLVDRQIELQVICTDQERFLRNMALVGLASLLYHSLSQMARTAESFSPRKKRYNDPTLERRPSDFEKLWIEFEDRFRFDLRKEHSLTGFIKTLNDVRNQIVHDGGLANPPKYWQDVEQIELQPNTPIDTDVFLDLKFSRTYSKFVTGEGALAEVAVSAEQLEYMFECAKKLVDHCAEEIRAIELFLATSDEQLQHRKTQ